MFIYIYITIKNDCKRIILFYVVLNLIRKLLYNHQVNKKISKIVNDTEKQFLSEYSVKFKLKNFLMNNLIAVTISILIH